MLNKKGQGLSMNVIIIAALALLVLVILAVLVINALSKVPASTNCYALDGADCYGEGECPSGFVHQSDRDVTCNPGVEDRQDYDQWCCNPLG